MERREVERGVDEGNDEATSFKFSFLTLLSFFFPKWSVKSPRAQAKAPVHSKTKVACDAGETGNNCTDKFCGKIRKFVNFL